VESSRHDSKLVNSSVRELFREVAGVPRNEREQILAQRGASPELRAAVESLLQHDSSQSDSLTRRVSDAAQEALEWNSAPVSRRCGPYRLIHLLGAGGMGAVYLAERRDGEIEQRVAIKFLRADADRPAWRERFLRERQLLAYLNHSSIARLLDAGHTEEGRPYLVMEHVDGVAIDEYASELDLRSRLRLFLLVCEGASHAHQHSIVHRDLKPSNILVDASGRPKLLDFGIAKLLDSAAGNTRTVERMLTPDYASPEQRRGDAQTTATDIYSLGAVLYKLLTGRSPHEALPEALQALPRDVGHVLRKAMRYEPSERYHSVPAFAEDIQAILESRPVHARSADRLYRIRKFLMHYRVTAAMGLTASAAVALTWNIAKVEREIGSLALEVGHAYSALARSQGINMAATSGNRKEAEESLRKASTFMAPVLSADPDNRKALLTTAKISHDRMMIAESERRNEEALAQAREAVRYLDRLQARGELSAAESDTAAELFHNIALLHKNHHLPDDAIRYARRSIELSRSSPDAEVRLSEALSMLADLLRLTGDLDGALLTIREARARLENATFRSETERRSSWCRVLGREGKILGTAGISLNRPDEAITVLQQVFEVLEEWTQQDRNDAWSRLLFASVGRELGDTLRLRDPQRALAVYDHALRRLGEITDNDQARRGEVELLAGASYSLRRLNRIDHAKERLDTAFRLLAETNDYPAEAVVPHEAAYAALRALADHHSETGNPQRAAGIYQELLGKILNTKPDPLTDLRHALAFSEIYGSLGAIYRRMGEVEKEREFSELRLELWNHWDRKLPNSRFVRRQLESSPFLIAAL
jgi:tetratricopeptide (TPR) repeat protein